MRVWAGLICVLTCVLVPAVNCIDLPWDRVCTLEFAYGLSATVKHASTGVAIDNAVLTLRDGDYVEVMQLLPTGSYAGAGERPGTYDLTIEVPGVATDTISGIEVTSDECHVRGIALDIRVAPGQVFVIPFNFACTEEARSGLLVNVKNASNNQPVTNAVLTIAEDSYTEELQAGTGGQYSGAIERRGTYTLTVEAPGFATETVEDVVVTQGLCHVNQTELTVDLQPAQ